MMVDEQLMMMVYSDGQAIQPIRVDRNQNSNAELNNQQSLQKENCFEKSTMELKHQVNQAAKELSQGSASTLREAFYKAEFAGMHIATQAGVPCIEIFATCYHTCNVIYPSVNMHLLLRIWEALLEPVLQRQQ